MRPLVKSLLRYVVLYLGCCARRETHRMHCSYKTAGSTRLAFSPPIVLRPCYMSGQLLSFVLATCRATYCPSSLLHVGSPIYSCYMSVHLLSFVLATCRATYCPSSLLHVGSPIVLRPCYMSGHLFILATCRSTYCPSSLLHVGSPIVLRPCYMSGHLFILATCRAHFHFCFSV